MPDKTKNKSGKVGKHITFLIVIFIFIILLLYKFKINEKPLENSKLINVEPTLALKATWVDYVNKDYKYLLQYPLTLTVVESKDEGGYLHFTRFNENGLTADKGIGVGVRKSTLVEEVNDIQKDLDNEIGAKLVSKEDIVFGSSNGVKLQYEPKSGGEGEKRTIVILHKGDFSYSISTVPEQIDKVLEGFKLTD